MIYQRKKALTFSGIMITIAVIGIILALVIPPIMNYKQLKDFKQKAKFAYTKSAQAFTRMKLNGTYIPNQNSYNNVDFDFKNNFMENFEILKNCGNNDECVAKDKSGITYKTLYGIEVPNQKHFANGQFITEDGMFYAIDDNSPEVYITVDVNGFKNTPNKFGVDTYMFYIDNNGNFRPMGTADSLYTAISHCQRETWSTGWGCMYNVLQDIDY